MKKLAFFILLGVMGWGNAQTTEIKYIPSIATDTIKAPAQLYNNLLSKGKFNPVIFENGIKVGERRQEVKLRDKDIFYIEFVDKLGEKRVFKQIPELKLGGRLLEVKASGKISWYRHYFEYKADAWDINYAYDDYFIKDKTITKIPVKGKYKKKLKALTSDQPELSKEISRMVNDQDIKEIIKKYNSN